MTFNIEDNPFLKMRKQFIKEKDVIVARYEDEIRKEKAKYYELKHELDSLKKDAPVINRKFIDRFLNNKHKLEAIYKEKHPENYLELVINVIKIIESDEHGDISSERVREIDDGDYQGTLLYLIADNSYQPSDYWYARVNYGSCSGRDTLEAIRNYDNKKPTVQQIKDYLLLSLHIVEWLRPLPNTNNIVDASPDDSEKVIDVEEK